jgi:cytochrome c peroxidase
VAFETGLFTAQYLDREAGILTRGQAQGGPGILAQQPFYLGINDPLGNNPTGAPFTSTIFTLYTPWLTPLRENAVAQQRASIARGEQVFNTKPVDITGVSGLNDVLGQAHLPGFCGTCHDTPNVGNHSVKAPLDIGVADPAPPSLDVAALPVFTLRCIAGPLAGQVFRVTDPGRALITGHCADIGKFKGPILRGLAARAPYFHNGSAGRLADVVSFYDQRFHIGLSEQEKTDLVNFLKAL